MILSNKDHDFFVDDLTFHDIYCEACDHIECTLSEIEKAILRDNLYAIKFWCEIAQNEVCFAFDIFLLSREESDSYYDRINDALAYYHKKGGEKVWMTSK